MRIKRLFFCLPLIFSLFTINVTAAQEDKSLEKYYIGNALYNKGLYKLAIDNYTAFLNEYPQNPKSLNAKLGLALSYYSQKDYSKAEPILEELSTNEQSPYRQLVHNLLGECYLTSNKPAQAEIAFKWCIQHGKERLYMELPGIAQKHSETPNISMATISDMDPLERSYAGLIESLYQQKKYNEVISYAKELFKIAPNTEFKNRVSLLEALSYYEIKEYKLVQPTLDDIFKAKDKDFLPQAYLLLADSQYSLKEYENAKKNYFIVVNDFKKGDLACSALYRLGTIFYREKAYERAIQQFSNLVSSYPSSDLADESALYVGRCYLNLKNYPRAERIFTILSNKNDIGAKATIWLARTFTRQNQLDKAEDTLKAGIEKHSSSPDLAPMLFSYGEVLLSRNKYDEAIAALTQANSIFKTGRFAADSLRLIAFAQNRKKEFAQSLATCDEFLEKHKGNNRTNDIRFLKAENLYFLDKYTEAQPLYERFVSIHGDKQKYTNESALRIAEISIKKEDFKKALDYLYIILNTPPADPFFEQLYYLAGYCAYKTGKYEQSIIFFKEFLIQQSNNPNTDAALIYSALAYAQLNKNDSAIPLLQKLIKEHPGSIYLDQAYMELGKHFYSLNDLPSAQKNFESVVSAFPDSKFAPHAKYYLGWVALNNNDYDKAFSEFNSLIKKYPTHTLASDSQFQKALILISQGKNQEAENELKIFIKNYKSDTDEASFYYALAVARSGDYKRSNELFTDFISNYPDSKLRGEALYEMAWNSRNQKDNDAAKKYYADFVNAEKSMDKRNSVVFELAEIEYDTENYNRSLELLNQLLAGQLAPDLKEKVMFRKAWCLMKKQDYHEAMRQFESFIYQFPDSSLVPVAAYQAGERRLENREFEAAYSNFKKAYDTLNKTNDTAIKEQVILRLGETQTLTNRWNDAEKSFSEFISTYPSSRFYYRAKMWLGWTLENLKRYKEAIDQYQAVVDTRQNSALAARSQFQIGECYYSMREFDAAVVAFVKVETDYDFPEWTSKSLLEMARVLILQKKNAQADQLLKKIIKDYKGTEEASLASDILSSREDFKFED